MPTEWNSAWIYNATNFWQLSSIFRVANVIVCFAKCATTLLINWDQLSWCEMNTQPTNSKWEYIRWWQTLCLKVFTQQIWTIFAQISCLPVPMKPIFPSEIKNRTLLIFDFLLFSFLFTYFTSKIFTQIVRCILLPMLFSACFERLLNLYFALVQHLI